MVARLFQLQILHNRTYADEARRVLMKPVRHLPFVRGTIRTADGTVLASDQPSWDVCLHYRMLSGDEQYLAALVEEATGCRSVVLNDADVAGIAEMRLGAGKDRDGLVMVLTLGAGIGSALFTDGRLVPNTELGSLEIGHQAELHPAPTASTPARTPAASSPLGSCRSCASGR